MLLRRGSPLLLLVLLLLLVACTNQLPVRLTDQVATSTVEELTEKSSKPVTGEGIYPASLIDEKTDETVRVDNAADLYRYMDRGYVLQSGIDHSMANMVLEVTQRAEHDTLRDRFYTVVTRDKDLRWGVLTVSKNL